ncbi:MAG: hypothetical protein QM737_16210 [Ferruginibacter sp.]
MTLTQYISLNDEQRYILWLGLAVKVASYDSGFYLNILFQLDSFYIEMRLFKLFPDQVKLYIITDEKWLDPYLEKIDISKLAGH